MIDPATLKSVRDRIDKARLRAGRQQEPPVEIVAITKAFPASTIIKAYDASVRAIGENRVQEAARKFQELPPLAGLEKRLVGHLQSNKARKAVDLFDTIDSIDSLKMARRLGTIAAEQNRQLFVLIQVNSADDPGKFGFDVSQKDQMLEVINMDRLTVEGLMTIGELTEDESRVREAFRRLRNLRDELNTFLPPEKQLNHLSMGMSGDFEIAVEEGATMVRLGTALFGPRPG